MNGNGKTARVHVGLGSRDELARVAAAIGCPLDDVAAVVVKSDGNAVALWTTGTDDLTTARLWRASLTWNFARQLVVGPRVELTWDELLEELTPHGTAS